MDAIDATFAGRDEEGFDPPPRTGKSSAAFPLRFFWWCGALVAAHRPPKAGRPLEAAMLGNSASEARFVAEDERDWAESECSEFANTDVFMLCGRPCLSLIWALAIRSSNSAGRLDALAFLDEFLNGMLASPPMMTTSCRRSRDR